MINVDVANNLLTFILGVLAIFGMLIGLIVKAVTLSSKVHDLERDLADHKTEMQKENLRLEGKFESLQLSVIQILQGVGRLEGKMESIASTDRRN